VTLLRVTLLPLPSDVVVSRTVDPSESFDVLDFTEDVDFFDPDEPEPEDWDFELAADFELSADFDPDAFEPDDFDPDDFDAEDSAAAFEPVGCAAFDTDDSVDADVSFDAEGSVEAVPSVDSREVVTSTADASAERVVVWVVRERSVGSVRVERVVTAPVDGSTARARVVTTPVEGSVSVEELPSGDVVTRGAAEPVGAAPVVVVMPSDEPAGASVDAGPSVGIGQPSGCAPDPREPAPEPVFGASGES
jgi:hypothetical protein